ncbi:HAD hydrolase family protein [Lactococcus insecticola]|uniref:Hydrolase n=1 Tax=Pseudolactococcus insecticola TaxID=2709158 RepID=A0A6A0B7P8_9LACT|nr:HAD hydrolase family protein [Lactococcus insecticola]GFH40481.1 hypothetical protein Hs20B_08790 [Lactococcus insecticola]
MKMKHKETLPIVFDLYGTIVFDGKNIPEDIKHLLKYKLSNHEIIFASARPIRDMTGILTDFLDHTWIGGNGSIVKQNHKIHVENVIKTKDFSTIKTVIEKNNLDYLIDDEWDYAYKISGDRNILEKVDQEKIAKRIRLRFYFLIWTAWPKFTLY